MHEKNKVIIVPESPEPTRNKHLMTSATHRKMAESMRARRRGGRARHARHRRSITRVLDPVSHNDCAFACILRIAGKACTKQNVQNLREKTAERVYMAYVNDETYHGHHVRDMVGNTGHTLAAYLALLRWRLWASPIEVCMAAEVEGVKVAVSAGHGLMVHGDKPKYLVRLADKHYTLHYMRKVPMGRLPARQGRGGMHNAGAWTWEHSAPNTVSILSLPPAATVPELREEVPEWAIPAYAAPGLHPAERETKVVKLEISPILRTDVSLLHLTVRTSLTPCGLRQRLEEILMVPADRLRVTNDQDQALSEHRGLPDEVKVYDMFEKHATVYDVLDIIVEGSPQRRFMIKVDQTWTHDDVVLHLATIMQKEQSQVKLLDMTGIPWKYPEDARRTSTVVLRLDPTHVPQVDLLGTIGELRGGAKTVSSTQSFHGNGNHGQEVERVHMQTEEVVEENEVLENPDVPEEQEVHAGVYVQGEKANLKEGVVTDERDTPNRLQDREGDPQPNACHGGEASGCQYVMAAEAPKTRQQQAAPEHEAVAWVGGGLVYTPTARALTAEALRRHDMRQRSRSPERRQTRHPDTVASSTAPSEAMITSTAWPSTPTPAQPDMIIKPVHDDIEAVGTLRAFPTADVTDVVMELIEKVKPSDLVHV